MFSNKTATYFPILLLWPTYFTMFCVVNIRGNCVIDFGGCLPPPQVFTQTFLLTVTCKLSNEFCCFKLRLSKNLCQKLQLTWQPLNYVLLPACSDFYRMLRSTVQGFFNIFPWLEICMFRIHAHLWLGSFENCTNIFLWFINVSVNHN